MALDPLSQHLREIEQKLLGDEELSEAWKEEIRFLLRMTEQSRDYSHGLLTAIDAVWNLASKAEAIADAEAHNRILLKGLMIMKDAAKTGEEDASDV